MSLWRSYTSLSPQKKVFLGAGMIAWSVIGLYMTDKAEKQFGFDPTPEDTAELKKMIPTISVVDRDR